MVRARATSTHNAVLRPVMVTTPPAHERSSGLADRQDQSLRRAARGGMLNLVAAALAGLATFGLTVAVTRALPLNVAGVFFATTSVLALLVTVGRLGTDTSLVYFLARCRALGRSDLITSYVRVALRPVVVTGVVMGIGLFVLAPTAARWIAEDDQALATSFLRTLSVVVPFVGIEFVLLAATRGLGTMRPNALVEQITRPITQLILVCGALIASETSLVPWAWGAAYVLASVLATGWWARLRRARNIHPGRCPVAREFWRFSIPRSLTGAAQVGMQRLDIILVAALAGIVPAAIYTATTRFIVLGQFARNAVSQAVQPSLAEALARRDQSQANRLYQVSTAWLILVSWPIYLILSTSGEPLLQVFGHTYASGFQVLLVLSLGMLVAIGCGDVDIVLVMAGRPTWSMWNVFLAFATNIALDLWLIPIHGAVGAAIGWSAAMAIKNLTALLQVGLVMRLHPVGPASLAAAGSAALAFLAVPLSTEWIQLGDAGHLIVDLALGFIIYGVLLWRLRNVLELTHIGGLLPGRAARRRHQAQGQPVRP